LRSCLIHLSPDFRRLFSVLFLETAILRLRCPSPAVPDYLTRQAFHSAYFYDTKASLFFTPRILLLQIFVPLPSCFSAFFTWSCPFSKAVAWAKASRLSDHDLSSCRPLLSVSGPPRRVSLLVPFCKRKTPVSDSYFMEEIDQVTPHDLVNFP